MKFMCIHIHFHQIKYAYKLKNINHHYLIMMINHHYFSKKKYSFKSISRIDQLFLTEVSCFKLY